MTTVKRIAKNTGILFISSLFNYLFGFVYTIYSARYLGVSGFGILSFAIALGTILAVFTDLGLGSLTTREISRDTTLANKYLSNILSIKLILSLFAFGFVVLFIQVFSYDYTIEAIYSIYIVCISYLLNNFSSIFYSVFNSYEKMEYQSIGQILNSFLILIGVFIVVFYSLDILGFALIYLVSSIIVLILNVILFTRNFFLPKFKKDTSFWKAIMKEALPLSFYVVFSIVAFRIDTIILSLLKGDAAVGIYTAGYKLMEALLVVSAMYTTAIFPVLSKFYMTSKNNLKFSFKKSFKYLFMLGLPIAVGVTLLSGQIIEIFYSESYNSSILVLQIVIWTIPFIFVNSLFRTTFTSINKQKLLLNTTLIGMAVNIVLNLLIIPIYGYIGSAVITVLTEFIYFVICFYYFNKYHFKIEITKIIYKPIIASLGLALFIITTQFNLIIKIIIGTLIYFIILIATKYFSNEDLELFKKIFS